MSCKTFQKKIQRQLQIEERSKKRTPKARRQTIKRVVSIQKELSSDSCKRRLKNHEDVLELGL